MNKIIKTILGVAVAIVASINVHIANNIYEHTRSLSLLNLENISNADECTFYTSTEKAENGRTLSITTNSCNGGAVSVKEYFSSGGVRYVYTCNGKGNTSCKLEVSGQIFTGTGVKSVK